jgi:hypothetical protein
MGCGTSSLAGVDVPGEAPAGAVAKRGGVDVDAFGDERVCLGALQAIQSISMI